GIEQDAEVLGDRRAGHLEMPRHRAHGVVGLSEQIEHPPARGMTDRSEDIRLAFESHYHAVTICKEHLTCQVRTESCRLRRAGYLDAPLLVLTVPKVHDQSRGKGCARGLPGPIRHSAHPAAPALQHKR